MELLKQQKLEIKIKKTYFLQLCWHLRSVVKGTNGRGVGRAGKGCMDKNI